MKKTLKNLFNINQIDESADFTIEVKTDYIHFVSDNTSFYFEAKFDKKTHLFETFNEHFADDFKTQEEFKSKCLIIANALIKKEKNISKIELLIFNQFYGQ